MKKLLIFLFLILLITGCNNPTSPKGEVQKLFLNYNALSSDLLVQLDTVMKTENLSDKQKSKYKDILKKQYEDLKYKINNEIISGDKAIVNVEIEVYDLKKTMDDVDKYLLEHREEFYINDSYSNEKFWDYKLDKMENTNDRIKYTFDLSLTKIDNDWHLDQLLESDRQKIHGLY